MNEGAETWSELVGRAADGSAKEPWEDEDWSPAGWGEPSTSPPPPPAHPPPAHPPAGPAPAPLLPPPSTPPPGALWPGPPGGHGLGVRTPPPASPPPSPPSPPLPEAGRAEPAGGGDADTAAPLNAVRPAPAKRRPSAFRLVGEYAGLAFVAIFLAFLIRSFLGLAYYIPSESMEPTLMVRDRVVVTRLSYKLHDPHRGDVVVFDNPNFTGREPALPVRFLRSLLEVVGMHQPDDKNLIKRVIGLPGETVEGRNGRVYINGQVLAEPWLPPGVQTSEFEPVTIPPKHVWMMGDNRGNSSDSRVFGPIRESTIVGRAFARIWPFTRLGWL